AGDALRGLLADPDDGIRHRAALALILFNVDDPGLVAALSRSLRDDRLQFRDEAAAALRRLGKSAVPGLLVELQAKGAKPEQCAAVAAVLAAPELRDSILETATNGLKDAETRTHFAIVFSKMEPSFSVPYLAKIVRDRNRGPGMRAGAAYALGEIKDAAV